MKSMKNKVWNFNSEIEIEVCNSKVKRKILAYSDELMCVENHFETGGVGSLHHHPHTQITYVVSGVFEFEIGAWMCVSGGGYLVRCFYPYARGFCQEGD